MGKRAYTHAYIYIYIYIPVAVVAGLMERARG